jgi:hypothetical protein
MRMLIAGLFGALVGVLQQALTYYFDGKGAARYDLPWSHWHFEDTGIFLLAMVTLMMVELICVMALYMYRCGPWICRMLGAEWEAGRIGAAKVLNEPRIVRSILVAVLLRRSLLFVSGVGSFLGLACALLAFLPLAIPRHER